MSKTSWQVKERYNKKNYVRFSLQVRREIGEPFKLLCKAYGVSMNQVISEMILAYMEERWKEDLYGDNGLIHLHDK